MLPFVIANTIIVILTYYKRDKRSYMSYNRCATPPPEKSAIPFSVASVRPPSVTAQGGLSVIRGCNGNFWRGQIIAVMRRLVDEHCLLACKCVDVFGTEQVLNKAL